MFIYELSGCEFESRCSHLNFRYRVFFEHSVPWHPSNCRVWIHSEARTWHNRNTQSYLFSCCGNRQSSCCVVATCRILEKFLKNLWKISSNIWKKTAFLLWNEGTLKIFQDKSNVIFANFINNLAIFEICDRRYRTLFAAFSSRAPPSTISTPEIKNLDVKHDILFAQRYWRKGRQQKKLKKYLPFRKNVGFCLIKLIETFREQSSLKYRLTLCFSSLSPIHIKDAISVSLYSRFKKLLQCLDELGEFRWISSKTEIEYRKFISEANIREEMSEFEMSERLDKFYASLLDNTKMNLWKVVKLRLILSHGNARAESGFS